jgi:hypothetical protein
MTALEALARVAWERWGGYAKSTICAACGEFVYCRSKSGKRYLCVDCFDQGER